VLVARVGDAPMASFLETTQSFSRKWLLNALHCGGQNQSAYQSKP
jgi:hypothetical protein